jgi:hypothetical protein
MLRIIYDLTLIIYYIQIDAYKSRIISLIKACDLVLTKSYIYDRFCNIFKNLRGKRETVII